MILFILIIVFHQVIFKLKQEGGYFTRKPDSENLVIASLMTKLYSASSFEA